LPKRQKQKLLNGEVKISKKVLKIMIAALLICSMTFGGIKEHIFGGSTPIKPDLRTEEDKNIDSAALEILHRSHGDFTVLDKFLASKGYIRVKRNNDVSIKSTGNDIDLSLERYVYSNYLPLKQKVFIYFDWKHPDPYPGSPDRIGIAWDSNLFYAVGCAYSAYSSLGAPENDKMWLSDTVPSTYTWELNETGSEWYYSAYVDNGAAVVTLQAWDRNNPNLGTMYGKYCHTYNTTSVSVTIGYPWVMSVTAATGSDYWERAPYPLYP